MSSLASAAVAFDAEALVELFEREPKEAFRQLAHKCLSLSKKNIDLKYEIRALHGRVERLEDRRLPRS